MAHKVNYETNEVKKFKLKFHFFLKLQKLIMNLNLVAYGIYLTLTAIIIVYVGKLCYRNGNIFIQNLLKNNYTLAHQINKILLVAYYLINLGYCAITLLFWDLITSKTELITVVSYKISLIVLIIAILHYINIFMLQKFIHKFI